jgi:hypothetical protein
VKDEVREDVCNGRRIDGVMRGLKIISIKDIID